MLEKREGYDLPIDGAKTLIEAVTHTLRGRLPMLGGMAAYAASGFFATGDVRLAIIFAAVAAAAIDVLVGVGDRYRTAFDRRLASATVASAASVLLDALIQHDDGIPPIIVYHPELTLRKIGAGQRLHLTTHNVMEQIRLVRTRLYDNRQLFLATLGTQIVLLDEDARRVALDAQRELDGAIGGLDSLRRGQSRVGVLKTYRLGAKAVDAYVAAALGAIDTEFHAFSRDVAELLGWLERPEAAPPKRRQPAVPGDLREQRTSAARAIAANVVDKIIQGGGRASNWYAFSSLAGVQKPTLRDMAALEDLEFSGQAVGNGWITLHEGLQTDGRMLAEVSDAIAEDLQREELNTLRQFRERLVEVATAAYDAREAEAKAGNAHATKAAEDVIAGADDTYGRSRQFFLTELRSALKLGDAVLARKPAGFEDEPAAQHEPN